MALSVWCFAPLAEPPETKTATIRFSGTEPLFLENLMGGQPWKITGGRGEQQLEPFAYRWYQIKLVEVS